MKEQILKKIIVLKRSVKARSSFFADLGKFSVLPIILLIIFLSLILIDRHLQSEINFYRLSDLSMLVPVEPYPVLINKTDQFVSAKAMIVIDDDSKVTLFKKNSNIRFSMASTTKIMTALTALDYFKPDDILTIKRSRVEGTNVGFVVGEKLYFDDVLYAMLLPSGNDAAMAIADNYPGGEAKLVTKMNEKALKLHLLDTHFGDPAGLLDDEDFTTVRDLARLASVAIKNPTIARITSTKQRFITSVDGLNSYTLNNLNKLLGVYGVNGVKTGQTEGAGGVLVTSSVQNGHTYIIVIMKSEDRFYDTEILLSSLFGNVSYFTPKSSKEFKN